MRMNNIVDVKTNEINSLKNQQLENFQKQKEQVEEQERRHFESTMALEHNKAELMIKHNEIRNDKTKNIIELNEKFENEKKMNELKELDLKVAIKNIEEDL